MNSAPQPSRASAIVTTIGAVLLVAALWIAHQGSIFPQHDEGGTLYPVRRFLGTIHLLLTTLPWIAGLWLAMAGFGWPVRRFLLRGTRFPFVTQLGTGLGLLLIACWFFALAGALNAIGAWLVLALGWLLLVWQLADPTQRHLWKAIPWPRVPWPVALAGFPIGIILVAATCPPGTMWGIEARGYDVLSYHLQLPREWLALGAMRGLHHNVYSYLPSLMESGYMLIGALRGSMYEGIYAAQLFHASLALLAAGAIGCAATAYVGALAGAVAGVSFLALPWTIVTGSMAYNEMAVMALGATAMLVVAGERGSIYKRAGGAGFLVGCATLAKLTAGPMIAVPVGLMILIDAAPGRTKQKEERAPCCPWRAAAIAAVVGCLTLTPYLVRNYQWTHNPVFPFATNLFGKAHWTDEEADRWRAGHAYSVTYAKASEAAPSRLSELGRHWLFNTGYGAIGGSMRRAPHAGPDYRNVATFRAQWGVPVFWLAALAGAVVGLTSPGLRRPTIGLLVMLAIQIAFWLAGTHLQSRFLLPSLIPGCVLIGLLVGSLANRETRAAQGIAWIIAAMLPVTLGTLGFTVFLHETGTYPDGDRIEPWRLSDSLMPADLRDQNTEGFVAGDHPINHTPPGSKVLLVADVSRLLYLNRAIVYNSAFDHNPLGDIIRSSHGDPGRVTTALKAMGVTHVWINWGELHRLHTTYGFDRDVTPQTLLPLLDHWRLVYPTEETPGEVVLFALP